MLKRFPLPRRSVALAAFGLGCCLAFASGAAPAAEASASVPPAPPERLVGPPPIADFFRRSTVNSSIASPSGRYAALTVAGGKYGRMRLVILDLSDVSKSTLLAEFDDEDIVNVQWVNDDRLVFQLSDLGKAVGERTNYGLM